VVSTNTGNPNDHPSVGGTLYGTAYSKDFVVDLGAVILYNNALVWAVGVDLTLYNKVFVVAAGVVTLLTDVVCSVLASPERITTDAALVDDLKIYATLIRSPAAPAVQFIEAILNDLTPVDDSCCSVDVAEDSCKVPPESTLSNLTFNHM
jgi:hypothetical protein